MQERINKVGQWCTKNGTAAFFVRDTANIEWLTGFESAFDEERAHAVFVPAGVARTQVDGEGVDCAAALAEDGGEGVDFSCDCGTRNEAQGFAIAGEKSGTSDLPNGGEGVASAAAPAGVAGAAALHTDSRYITVCEKENARCGGIFELSQERATHTKWARGKFDSLAGAHGVGAQVAGACAGEPSPSSAKLAVEDSMSLAEFRRLERDFEGAGVAFVETSDVILGLRAVKDGAEIARLKAAQAITDEAFARVLPLIKPGMTEIELRYELDNLMFGLGATQLAFPTIIAAGENGASPHAQPGNTRLEAGMCVVMDFGAKRAGYCSDMTRTVFLGAPEGEMLCAWEAIRAANEAVEQALCPGMTGVEAHNMAEDILARAGFEGKMGHGLGHGVGLEIHEEPCLNLRNTRPLQPGNVVTVEPGIYLPGKFGMRLEDFGVITENGFEVFTQSTHKTIIL